VRSCIGTNQIDLNAASDGRSRGLQRPVLEHPQRGPSWHSRRSSRWPAGSSTKNGGLHAGVWDKSAAGSHEVRGRDAGHHRLRQHRVAAVLLAESSDGVIFYDIIDKLALGNARRCDSLDELLADAEVVSLHVDGRPGNAGFFTSTEFAKMRPRSLFLNLCRGMVVDLEALREALVSGRVAGAAIDVFPNEPHENTEDFVSPLPGFAERDPDAACGWVDHGGASATLGASLPEAGRL